MRFRRCKVTYFEIHSQPQVPNHGRVCGCKVTYFEIHSQLKVHERAKYRCCKVTYFEIHSQPAGCVYRV